MEKSGSTFHWDGDAPTTEQARAARGGARTPTDGRIVTVQQALRGRLSVEEVHETTGIDPWFLDQIALNEVAERVAAAPQLTPDLLRLAKRHGFSDVQLASLRHAGGGGPRGAPRPRRAPGLQDGRHVRGGVRRADALPLLLVRRGDRGRAREKPAVIILGSGPNRIGQGVEFDYSCVHPPSPCATPATRPSW